MTGEIQRSFRELLNKINWIDDDTKRLATEKVNAMSLKIGYPDFILQPHLLNERYKDVIYFYILYVLYIICAFCRGGGREGGREGYIIMKKIEIH